MASADRITVAAKAFVSRSFEVLRDRCPAERDEEFEEGPRWVEDTEHEGTIARFGDFKTFRLTPKVSDPTTACAWRELAQMHEAGIAEYRELVESLETIRSSDRGWAVTRLAVPEWAAAHSSRRRSQTRLSSS